MIESGHRALFGLEEQLHASSTFYFPTNTENFISISRYFLPQILVLTGFVIQAMVSYYHMPQIEEYYQVLIKHFGRFVFGFSGLTIPMLNEIIFKEKIGCSNERNEGEVKKKMIFFAFF